MAGSPESEAGTQELQVVAPQAEVQSASFSSEVESSQAEGVAFAAAASAGTSATAAPGRQESELAEAWASWKQVRDSVASPQFTAQMADAAAAGLKEARQEAKAQLPDSATEDNSAIASIVDSVLAELKPKLMEEIAKKMAREKK